MNYTEDTFFTDLLDSQTASKQITQGSEQWEQIRIGRFTSSEIHKLITQPRSKADKEAGKLSETALTYINVKVAESITGQKKADSYAFPLVYGKQTEPEAVEYFCERTGFIHTPIGFIVFGDHAGGSPDGIINDTDILEVKCPYALDTHIDYLMLTDQYDLLRVKPEYYWQVQSNLLFSGKDQGHFVSYDPRYPEKQRIAHIIVKPVSEHFDIITASIAKAVKEKLSLIQILTN